MAVPSVKPFERHPSEVAPTDTYHADDPVWVYLDGTWRPGVVEFASELAATVVFLRERPPGTGVDISTATYLVARTDPEPILDELVYG